MLKLSFTRLVKNDELVPFTKCHFSSGIVPLLNEMHEKRLVNP